MNLRKSPFALYYLEKRQTKKVVDTSDNAVPLDSTNIGTRHGTSYHSTSAMLTETDDTSQSVLAPNQQNKNKLAELWEKAKQNFNVTDGLLYSLVYAFTLTFICYPGLATDNTYKFLLSNNSYDSWRVLTTQITFTSFDVVGRILGSATW